MHTFAKDHKFYAESKEYLGVSDEATASAAFGFMVDQFTGKGCPVALEIWEKAMKARKAKKESKK